MPRVLFVDGDTGFLEELDTLLKPEQQMGEFEFIASGREALEKLSGESGYDLIVSGLQTLDMDGTDFLINAKETCPEAVRFCFLNDGQDPGVEKVSTIAHQFLHRVLDPHEIRILIARAMLLREHLRKGHLKQRLHDVGGLPSLPALYQQIVNELHSPDASMGRMGELIEKDPSMSVKLLQIVNSAGLGLTHRVSNIVQAASLLGMQKLSSMVLMVEVFALASDESLPQGFSIESLWKHSLRVANGARAIAAHEVHDDQIIDNSFTAGLLHDLGLIIVATRMGDEFSKALTRAVELEIPLFDAERDTFDSTHAEIGGYLLELWGLPDPLVEGVTFHDAPSAVPEHCFTPLTAVHVANYFCEDERKAAFGCVEEELDTPYLERIGFVDRMETWWELCQESEESS